MTRLRSGFTLIELLVVVAIIALLIAILLPSLSGAREQTRTVVCLSNMRQLSHGWHMYADDNNDTCLPGRYAKFSGGTSNPANYYDIGNGTKYRPRWIATMGGYVGLPAWSNPIPEDDRQDYDGKVYQCPKVPNWTDTRNHCYGYNHQFLGNARKTNGKYHNYPVNRSRLSTFAGTVMATDCLGTAAGVPKSERQPYSNDGKAMEAKGNHGWTLDPPRLSDRSDRGTGDAGSLRTAPDARHRGRTNALFCDGHARSATVYELGYRVLDDGQFIDLEPTEDDPPLNNLFCGFGGDRDAPPLPE